MKNSNEPDKPTSPEKRVVDDMLQNDTRRYLS